MDPIDKLLSELQAEYKQSENSQSGKTEEVKEVKKTKKINLDSSFPSSSLFESSSKGDAIDNILSEVKKEIEENSNTIKYLSLYSWNIIFASLLWMFGEY